MEVTADYTTNAPSRTEVDAHDGPLVIEFGAPWCGHCRAAQALIATAFAGHHQVRHLKIEDGPGRRLGRSFQVTLWPTLIFMHHGQEIARLVRPGDAEAIAAALRQIDTP